MAMYNARMSRQSVKGLVALVVFVLLPAGFQIACSRSRDVAQDLRIVDARTGWYDAGIVDGKNKIVPSIAFKLQNISQEEIARVQVNAIFRRQGEPEAWGEHFVTAIDRDGLPAGQTGGSLVLRSNLGYTGTESRLQMLQNTQFVDARVEIFGKHGSRTWQKLGEYKIDRQLLTQ